MSKALSLIAVAATLTIFGSPAVAHAENPMIKDQAGAAVGTVQATSENPEFTVGSSPIQCATSHLSLQLSQNTHTTAAGTYVGTATGDRDNVNHTGTCTILPSKLQVHFISLSGSIHIDGNLSGTNTGTVAFNYTITHPVLGTIGCSDKGTVGITYEFEASKIRMEGTLSGTENIPPCSPERTFHADFLLYDEIGNPVTVG